ncbi:MAG TPA: LuxR C-terminal-related transcriptional regulator [Gemmatimonadales bacterium]|nr:LuxR C-terminal-related transcriptional regulator [Gemmatimonadales bacterium]
MPPSDLERARECYQRRQWREAHDLLSLADRSTTITAEDLGLLASSAYLLGRDADFQRYFERVHLAHLESGDHARAARWAFWLSLTALLRGDVAQSNGWLTRGQRLIAGLDCVEHGYLLLPVAEQHLGERNAEAALSEAAHAAQTGERFKDPDLITIARHLQGRTLIQLGRLEPGLALLDEAMVAVVSGELSPIVTGLIYCSVIDACQQAFALGRAREWTLALARWCEQQPDLVAFTGTCLIHRAAVMQFQGAWGEAMTHARQASEPAGQTTERKPPAAAFYRLGELHRLKGEFDQAESAFREASRLGIVPQPGLALLRLTQGRTDAACSAIHRVLETATDPLTRARFIPAYVEIAIAAGQTHDAGTASEELETIAAQYPTDMLRALAAQTRGAVELARGNAKEACGALRHAFERWQGSEAPYETARTRLLLALACRELGDHESCELEFDAARAGFEQLGAAPDLARLDSLRREAAGKPALTLREIEVLRHVAAGRTNKEIASELRLSNRTIDRHVSNILTKLDVPSRAAAAAQAASLKLL